LSDNNNKEETMNQLALLRQAKKFELLAQALPSNHWQKETLFARAKELKQAAKGGR